MAAVAVGAWILLERHLVEAVVEEQRLLVQRQGIPQRVEMVAIQT